MTLSLRPAGLWRLAAALCAAAPVVCAQPLSARADAGFLYVSAPKLRFLDGKPLERLNNGGSVIFAIQLTLRTGRDTQVLQRAGGRFAVSYDLWEEKFAVTKLGKPRHAVTHLSAAATEAWCVGNLALPVSGLSRDTPFWLRLEVRAEDAREDPLDEEEAFSLTRLVELFSRPPQKEHPLRLAEAGPLRLRDL